ncbi:MAG: type II secretion system F family protein [Planctomycetes bacterium]|nr:type II secretion system F family protein [Planctomycetota bacterium]
MPSYAYSALDANGQPITGEVAADGQSEAIAILADKSVFVTDIAAVGQFRPAKGKKTSLALGLPFRRHLRPRSRTAMLRQLATALQAGLPLLSALRVVHEQAESGALRSLMGQLAESVQAGQPLSDAMAEHPREFSQLESSMVRVGETAGALDEVMGYICDFAERDVEVREKIRSAAAYPAFVLALAVVSIVVIVTLILPRVIASVTEAVGSAALPGPTRFLLAVSEFSRAYWWLAVIIMAIGIWAFRAWLKLPRGRLAFDTFKLHLPLLGPAIRRIAVARFARTLGTLSAAGIQILEALHVLRDTLGNEALAQKVDEAAAGITQGQSIAEPLRLTGQFPPLLIQVIAMGEKTGRLDDLLLKTADAYEKETAAAIARVMTVLPAIMIVMLALVVAFILAAVLLPIVEMQTALPGI